MQTHDPAWGTSSVSTSASPRSETRAVDVPQRNTRPDPGLAGDFYVEWQQAAELAPAGQTS